LTVSNKINTWKKFINVIVWLLNMQTKELALPDRIEIRIAGKGGQGVIKAALILAKAAVYAGMNVAQIQNYGPEVRGGNSISDIVISKPEIDYPGITTVDILVVMSQKAYDANIHYVKPGGIVMADSTVKPSLITTIKTYLIPFTKIAEEVGNKIFANSVAVGALTAMLGLPKECVIKAMQSEIPPRFLEKNIIAFHRGYNETLKLKAHVSQVI